MFCQKCGQVDNGGLSCSRCGSKEFGATKPELSAEELKAVIPPPPAPTSSGGGTGCGVIVVILVISAMLYFFT